MVVGAISPASPDSLRASSERSSVRNHLTATEASITRPGTLAHLADNGRAIEISRPIELADSIDLGPDLLARRFRGFAQSVAGGILQRAAAPPPPYPLTPQ